MSKRPRHIACRTCRERKIRCDGNQPCSRCAGQSQPCVYATPATSDAGASELSQQLQIMNDRLAKAEAQLAANQAYPTWGGMNEGVPDPLASPNNYHYGSWGSNGYQTTVPPPLSPSPFISMPLDIESPPQDWTLDAIAGLTTVPQPPSDSSLSSSFSLPQSNYDDYLLTPQTMRKLQETCFDSFNLLFPMLDRWQSIANPVLVQSEPWKSSIYYAICTHGALVSGNPSLEEACYHRARKELELSDMDGSGSRFFRIETLQASILIALYEFRRSFLARAWVSHARCIRLVQLLALHKMDQGTAAPKEDQESEEKRLTFWVAYVFDCLISVSFGGSITFTEREITTRLPAYVHSGAETIPHQQLTLSQILQSPDISPESPFSVIIVLVTIWAQILRHVRVSESEELNDQAKHEFWASHHVLDGTLARVEAGLGEMGQFSLLSDPNIFFLNAAKHSAAISLYQAAAMRAIQTRLPVTLVETWEAKCKNSSMEIVNLSRVMLESNSLQNTTQFNPFILLSIYIACAYLARVIRSETPDPRILDPIENMLRIFNQPEMKAANPSLDAFLPRIFKELEETQPFTERIIDPATWLLTQK